MGKKRCFWVVIAILVFSYPVSRGHGFYLELGRTARSPKIVEIAPVGTARENGALLVSTVNGLTPENKDWHLIRLAPGEYDIGEEVLQLKSFMVLEGSGEICTSIVGKTTTGGVVSGATSTELRHLRVANINSVGQAVALYYENVGYPTRIYRVTAEASGGSGKSVGLYNVNAGPELEFVYANVYGIDTHNFGIYNISDSPAKLKHVEIRVSSYNGRAYGIYNEDSYVEIEDTDISVFSYTTVQSPSGNWTYGLYNHNDAITYIWDSYIYASLASKSGSWAVLNTNSGSNVVIDQSHLRGGSASVRNDNVQAFVAVAGSKIVGWVQGKVKCAANYYETYFFYPDTCPTAP